MPAATTASIKLQRVEWREEASFVVKIRRADAPIRVRPVESDATILNWSAAFLTIAVLAALLGFGGSAGNLAPLAKAVCVLFATLFLAGIAFARKLIRTRNETEGAPSVG